MWNLSFKEAYFQEVLQFFVSNTDLFLFHWSTDSWVKFIFLYASCLVHERQDYLATTTQLLLTLNRQNSAFEGAVLDCNEFV